MSCGIGETLFRFLGVVIMDLSIFNGKTLFVTGATGLIGQTLIKRVIEFNRNNCGRIKVIASVRNMEKAYGIFGEDNPEEELSYVVSDICSIPLEDMGIDYIVHTASNTSSKAFVERPMEIIETAVGGTKRVLELAKINGIRAMAYLSTMEVYGTPSTDEKIDERHSTNLDTMSVRSCYPESKRMCESICASYQKEYGVPTVVLRLTQTFGPGVQYDDGRVFAEFARCAIEGRDIVLKTKGETKREYLHVDDAVNAIFTSLIKGCPGEAYNVANEETYCSILEMAELVADRCAEGRISVRIQEEDSSKYGYAPTLHMNLDTSKFRDLGWIPKHNLEETFKDMIANMNK